MPTIISATSKIKTPCLDREASRTARRQLETQQAITANIQAVNDVIQFFKEGDIVIVTYYKTENDNPRPQYFNEIKEEKSAVLLGYQNKKDEEWSMVLEDESKKVFSVPINPSSYYTLLDCADGDYTLGKCPDRNFVQFVRNFSSWRTFAHGGQLNQSIVDSSEIIVRIEKL